MASVILGGMDIKTKYSIGDQVWSITEYWSQGDCDDEEHISLFVRQCAIEHITVRISTHSAKPNVTYETNSRSGSGILRHIITDSADKADEVARRLVAKQGRNRQVHAHLSDGTWLEPEIVVSSHS